MTTLTKTPRTPKLKCKAEYRGVVLKYDEQRNCWKAKIAGKWVKDRDIKAIKWLIDQDQNSAFAPFEAFFKGCVPEKVQVTGIRRHGYYEILDPVRGEGVATPALLIPVTEETTAVVEQLEKLEEQLSALREQLDEVYSQRGQIINQLPTLADCL